MQVKNKNGFTLIEMAIVLVIIGLILGAVLKGQSLITSSKKKRLIQDFRAYEAAFQTFYDQYGQYPGDENDLKGIQIPLGDTEEGNGNGYIDGGEDNNFGRFVWNDLAKGSIAFEKAGPFGGRYGWTSINFHPSRSPGINRFGNAFYATGIPAEQAQDLDLEYDDGIWNTGDLMADANFQAAAIVTLYWRL